MNKLLKKLLPDILFCTIFCTVVILLFLPAVFAADEIDIHCQNSLSGVETCIKDIAIKRNDIKLCDRIETDAMRGSCYGAFATTLGNIELCKKIPKDARGADARNRCFLKFVKGPEQMYVCTELIHEERAKDDCFSAVLDKKRDDPSFCANFATDKKRLSCYLKVIRSLDNPGLCQMILDEGKTKRKSQCRYCDVGGIDYDKEYQDCKKNFYLKGIENLCDVHDKQMGLKMAKGEKNELSFSGEDAERDRFWITFHWAVLEGAFETHTANIRYTDGVRHEAFDNLRVGASARGAQNDIGVQLLDMWSETEGGGDEDAAAPETIINANICVFRPSTRQKEEAKTSRVQRGNQEEFEEEQEQRRQELEKELEEEQQRKEQEEKEGKKANTTGASDDGADDTEKKDADDAEKDKGGNNKPSGRVKVREGGVFARLISFFKNLFL